MKNSLFRSLIDLLGSGGRSERDGEALRAAEESRRRLVLLRVGDGEIRRAVERVAYASGKYLESAAKGGPRDPRCEGALDEALAAVGDYLRLADAAAAESRFGGGPGTGVSAADAARTAFAVLSAAAREIEEALALGLGGFAEDGRGTGVAVADRAEARKELP